MYTIPNLLTLCNLICGCIALIEIFYGSYYYSAYWVMAGALFDVLDGLAARLLRAGSSIGKDLDSLADVVTFGVVPGMMVYKWLILCTDSGLWPYVGLLIPAFSALRLAKFNNDSEQTTEFRGLPTPANALFFISLPLMLVHERHVWALEWIKNPLLITALTVAMCLLLVSRIPMFSLKFNSFRKNEWIYPLAVVGVANFTFFALGTLALPISILSYIGLSVLKFRLIK